MYRLGTLRALKLPRWGLYAIIAAAVAMEAASCAGLLWAALQVAN
jgi:hypothetical protein